MGRLRAIESFPAGLPLHIPQVTPSKDVPASPAVALRMICDRVADAPSQLFNTPHTPRVLRHMDSEEAHLFAEGRKEPSTTASPNTIVAPVQPKVVSKPPRTLGRFSSEEAVKRFG